MKSSVFSDVTLSGPDFHLFQGEIVGRNIDYIKVIIHLIIRRRNEADQRDRMV
jgi:hypothetical protein